MCALNIWTDAKNGKVIMCPEHANRFGSGAHRALPCFVKSNAFIVRFTLCVFSYTKNMISFFHHRLYDDDVYSLLPQHARNNIDLLLWKEHNRSDGLLYVSKRCTCKYIKRNVIENRLVAECVKCWHDISFNLWLLSFCLLWLKVTSLQKFVIFIRCELSFAYGMIEQATTGRKECERGREYDVMSRLSI